MATTSRTKDRALGKDKRGISPSNSETSTDSQRGSRRQASTDKEKASEKPVPNYLKPTISSRNEPLKIGKKNNSHEDNQKLLRRRSFDKPPSASARSQKALTSPGPRDRAGSAPAPLVPRERKITVRSSSFGRHSVTTTRTVADPRVSKTPKAARSLPAGSKPIKTKSTPLINKKESSNNASASRKSSSTTDHETSSYEAKQEDMEDLAKEVEEVVNKVESETSELGSDINVPESETEEDVYVVEAEDEKINSCDISTCTSGDKNLIQESHIDQETDNHDHEDKLHDQVKADTQQEDPEKEKINEEETRSDSIPEETAIKEEAKTLKEIEEKDENHKDVSESIEDDDNNKVEEEKLVLSSEEAANEGIKMKEVGEVEGRGEEESKQDCDDGAATVVSKVQERQGKKESPSAAYNDVIEETASKLLEKRKNKVKALVGAFETVIDYESGSSK